MTGLGIGAAAAAAFLVAPALQAQQNLDRDAKRQVLAGRGGLGTFTPAAADPKLAAILARSGLPESAFRFTPSESRRGANRNVTVAVRARTVRGAAPVERTVATQPPSVSVAPIAYNLGVSVGWKRFAVSGDVTRIDLVNEPGSRERTDLGVSYSGKRASGRVQATGDRPLAQAPALIAENPSYSIDVGGSYSLTKNLDLTAGVRYKTEEQRLPRLTEDARRDSQSVYIGTAFRF